MALWKDEQAKSLAWDTFTGQERPHLSKLCQESDVSHLYDGSTRSSNSAPTHPPTLESWLAPPVQHSSPAACRWQSVAASSLVQICLLFSPTSCWQRSVPLAPGALLTAVLTTCLQVPVSRFLTAPSFLSPVLSTCFLYDCPTRSRECALTHLPTSANSYRVTASCRVRPRSHLHK